MLRLRFSDLFIQQFKLMCSNDVNIEDEKEEGDRD